jgi:Secretion system C-terminal sorting domain
MKRNAFLFLFQYLAPVLLLSQTWQSVNGGVNGFVRDFAVDSANQILVACGAFSTAGDSAVNHIAAFDGTGWDNIGEGTGNFSGVQVSSLESYQNELFACGQFGRLDSQYNPEKAARWNGADWVSCGDPDEGLVFRILNGQLFALGQFDTISGKAIKRIAVWDGVEWDAFAGVSPFSNSDGWFLSAGAYYKEEYYFAGNVDIGNLKEIIRWDGSTWNSVLNGVLGGGSEWVNDLVVYKGLLIVGGQFSESDGNPADYIMAWDGTQWMDPFPDVQFTSQVKSLAVINDTLFIVGGSHYLFSSTSQRQLAKYDGQAFCSFGTGDEWPSRIASVNNRIYVASGGWYITQTDTISYLAEWIGGTTTDICITQPIAIENPIFNDPKITLSPNPTNGVFEITLNAASAAADRYSTEIIIQITDVTGRVVAQQSLSQAGLTFSTQFDLSHCAPGVYFGRVDPIAIGCGDGQVNGFKVLVE